MEPTIARTRSTASPSSSPAAGVEAEADLDLAALIHHHVPEPGQRVESPRDGVVPAGRVLDVEGNLGLEDLQGAPPAAESRLDAVLRIPRVDDHRSSADVRGRLARLLQDLARAVAHVVLWRADVDEVRRVDVEGHVRCTQLAGVVPVVGLLPALRVREEQLHAIRAERLGLGERILRRDVGADEVLLLRWGHSARA
jgi:hypothetical protein